MSARMIVIGTGPIGGIIGGRLARGGNDMTFVDVDKEHVAAIRDKGLQVNVNGGAVALGHAIGQSGSRLLTTILYELKRRDARRGIVSLCLGGGNAVAIAIER